MKKIIGTAILSIFIIIILLASSYFLGLFCTSNYHENEKKIQREELKNAMRSYHEAMEDVSEIMRFELYWNTWYYCDIGLYKSSLL